MVEAAGISFLEKQLSAYRGLTSGLDRVLNRVRDREFSRLVGWLANLKSWVMALKMRHRLWNPRHNTIKSHEGVCLLCNNLYGIQTTRAKNGRVKTRDTTTQRMDLISRQTQKEKESQIQKHIFFTSPLFASPIQGCQMNPVGIQNNGNGSMLIAIHMLKDDP